MHSRESTLLNISIWTNDGPLESVRSFLQTEEPECIQEKKEEDAPEKLFSCGSRSGSESLQDGEIHGMKEWEETEPQHTVRPNPSSSFRQTE